MKSRFLACSSLVLALGSLFFSTTGAAFLHNNRLIQRTFVSKEYLHDGHKSTQLWLSVREEESSASTDQEPVAVIGVVAPLKYKGPYPCLSLRFPNQTSNQSDVILDFVLDTGANINSINNKVVEDLKLPLVFNTTNNLDLFPGAAGIGGALSPGDIYLLGDCQLAGLPPDQNFTFMRNLTAAAFPASPGMVADGLLSLSFFHCYPAGVEWDWYGTEGDPPTMIFYYGPELPAEAKPELKRVPLERLPSFLLSLNVQVNGTKIKLPAVLDTGSPITILSHQAAQQVGIATVPLANKPIGKKKQALGDDSLVVGGVDGGMVQLFRSVSPVSIQAGEQVMLGRGPVYVGNLPGMAFLLGATDDPSSPPPPVVVLGLDFLRQTYRMVLRATENEVWFEELTDQLTRKS